MLIGLTGYAQAGKDSVGNILVEQHGYQRYAFADALKNVLQDVDPVVECCVSRNGYPDPVYLGHELGRGWEHAKRHPEVRGLLQRLGVACRQHLGPDVWVDAVMRHIDDHTRRTDIVICDVRFPNEFEAVKARGGQIWRVERPGIQAVNGHISEHALDDWQSDWVIHNDGTLTDLAFSVASAVALR